MHCFISLEGLEMSSFPRSHILVRACLRIHLWGTLITNQDKNQLHHITVEACLPILCILSDLILLWALSTWQIIDHLDHLSRIRWNIWVGPTRMVVNKEVLVLLLSSHHRERGVLRLVHGKFCLPLSINSVVCCW
jgi:SNF family Na+-dependent transporter